MCGVNGVLRLGPQAAPIERGELLRTRDAMRSRGPDDAGEWWSPSGRVALAARRLAIQDLSDAGHQPMSTPDGRFTLVFNGEIYNFRELSRELATAGCELTSRCDTEVVLQLFARHGRAALGRLRGMFALAVWDELERRLVLARDPYGIKPLYYARCERSGLLRFASQVRALEAGGLDREPDDAGVAGFLLWGSVPEPLTIRRAARCLPAGNLLAVEDGVVGRPEPHYRFDALPAGGAPAAAAAVRESVEAHLVSDAPVGIFLSAGLDSAMVAACAARARPGLPTLTLRFAEFADGRLDEGPGARQLAELLGTEHSERWVGRDEFLELARAALTAMDQPSIDGFNVFLVSRVAHEMGWKVALSGMGGDELFGGYPSFRQLGRWRAAGRALARLPLAGRLWPLAARLAGGRRRKLRGLVRYGRSHAGAYFLRRGLFLPEELARLMGRERSAAALARVAPVASAERVLRAHGAPEDRQLDPWLAAHLLESGCYLRNQLLRDADWASMAHELELRLPLVDARLRGQVAAAGFQPARGAGRAAVARATAPGLPDAFYRRPKTGFQTPAAHWLTGVRPAGRRQDWGLHSRRLAVRVLGEFGVDLADDLPTVERHAVNGPG